VVVDSAIPHALVEGGDIEAGTGDGVGQQDEFRGSTGWTGGTADFEDCARAGRGGVEGLRGWGREAGEDRDFAMLDMNFDSALPSHDTSSLRLDGLAACESCCWT